MRPDLLAGMLLRKADWHDYDGMKYLLEHGADPNRMTMWGYTALHQALRRDNHLRNIELLLDHGADPTIKTTAEVRAIFTPDFGGKGQRSGFVIAAHRGRADVLAALERRGFAMEFSGVDRLIAACARGNAGGCQRSIAADEPRLVKELVAEGGRLLAEFAGNDNSDGVKLLLDLGVPVSRRNTRAILISTSPKDSTALHVAAWKAWPKTVKLLIERGAPIKCGRRKGPHCSDARRESLRGFLLDEQAITRISGGAVASRSVRQRSGISIGLRRSGCVAAIVRKIIQPRMHANKHE